MASTNSKIDMGQKASVFDLNRLLLVSSRMSLQWTFIATFLYSELAICGILMLPFISPTRWQRFFRSRLLNAMKSYANLYFNIFICVLVILFLDGIRDVRRFSSPIDEGDLKNNPQAEVVLHMKLFRAQRNFYIAGFALFLFITATWLIRMYYTHQDTIRDMNKYSAQHKHGITGINRELGTALTDVKLFRSQRNYYMTGVALFIWFVLRKLVTLISQQALLQAEGEAARKQAESATKAAQAMLEEASKASSKSKEDADNLTNEKDEILAGKEELQKLREQLVDAKTELKRSRLDLDVMKTQAEATNMEYDRLMKEHSQLQDKLKSTTEGANVEELKKLD